MILLRNTGFANYPPTRDRLRIRNRWMDRSFVHASFPQINGVLRVWDQYGNEAYPSPRIVSVVPVADVQGMYCHNLARNDATAEGAIYSTSLLEPPFSRRLSLVFGYMHGINVSSTTNPVLTAGTGNLGRMTLEAKHLSGSQGRLTLTIANPYYGASNVVNVDTPYLQHAQVGLVYDATSGVETCRRFLDLDELSAVALDSAVYFDPAITGMNFRQHPAYGVPPNFSYFYMFGDALEPEEVSYLKENPWQLFRADPIRLYFGTDAGAPSSMLRRWDGAEWQSGDLRRWDGEAWQPATLKRWNGSEWVT